MWPNSRDRPSYSARVPEDRRRLLRGGRETRVAACRRAPCLCFRDRGAILGDEPARHPVKGPGALDVACRTTATQFVSPAWIAACSSSDRRLFESETAFARRGLFGHALPGTILQYCLSFRTTRLHPAKAGNPPPWTGPPDKKGKKYASPRGTRGSAKDARRHTARAPTTVARSEPKDRGAARQPPLRPLRAMRAIKRSPSTTPPAKP